MKCKFSFMVLGKAQLHIQHLQGSHRQHWSMGLVLQVGEWWQVVK